MYTAFYGLREKPFALSPDPRFLYLAGSHREALAHLLYGIEQGEGFISVTGEVGTGKTTLCRTLLERLDGDTELAFLFNPSRTALELLQSICSEFGLPAEGLTRRALMSQLNHFLLEQKRAGKRVLLIIDEAQTLSDSTLEQVRLLSNLETSREKLIQILLLGQPELDRKLDMRALRQLRQRISVRWQLDPLSAQETRAYVRHRLAVAAGEPKDLFSEPALREVHRRTGGVPRLVNQLCDRALLAGYAARAAQIGPRLVRAAAREIPDTRRRRLSEANERRLRLIARPWPTLVATFALVGLSIFAGMQVGREGLSRSLRAALFEVPGQSAQSASSAAGTTANLPAVAANAPRAAVAPGATVDESDASLLDSPDDPEGPLVTELIGYLPEGGRPPAAGPGFVASTQTLAIPARPLPTLPEVTIAEGLLGRTLVAREAEASLVASQRALLARYGRSVEDSARFATDPASLARTFRSRGLAATAFDGGTIGLLRQLDHPFAVPLSPDMQSDREARARKEREAAVAVARANGTVDASALEAAVREASQEAELADARWVAVTGFDGDRAHVSGLVEGRTASVPVDELERHWLESGLIVWERFEQVPPVLRPDDDGDGVVWLQRALAELRMSDAPPSGEYDDVTSAAVGRFQQERGLVADGVAGPLTQIALYAHLDRYPVPRLSGATAIDPLPLPEVSAAPRDAAPVPNASRAVDTRRLPSDAPLAIDPERGVRRTTADPVGERG
jgi:type II secretory pathway predicted ATPase ExeA